MNELSSVFNEFYSQLFNYGKRFSMDHHLIEDAIQNIFVRLLKKNQPFEHVDNIKFYLLTSTRNELLRLLKKKSVVELVEITDMLFNMQEVNEEIEEEMLERREEYLQLNECLKKLPPKQREMIYLRFNAELSFEEISKMLNISIESCRTSLYRALKHIKEILQLR